MRKLCMTMKNKINKIMLLVLFASYTFGQQVKITSVMLPPDSNDNQPFRKLKLVDDVVTLTYQRNSIFIYFDTPGQSTEYAFRLGKVIPQEIYTHDNYVFLNNLPAGEHDFTIRVLNKPIWQKAHIKIIVQSPIWLRWWFIPLLFLYGLLLIGIIFYFLYRYRLRQLLHLQSVRESIARDLHDDMGSYLSSISVLSQSVVNLAQTDPPKAHALVQKIGETARQVMDSMGDIIWSVNPDNDSMNQIVLRMRDVGADLLEEQDVVFTLDVDENLLSTHLPLEHRRDFFLIYKEALNNTAKYAQASHVWVYLLRKDATLLLTIQDDGIGFDTHQQLVRHHSIGGNGLKNMTLRAEKMGGTLTIVSAPGQGTTVTLQIFLS